MTKKYFGTDGIRGAVNSKFINGDMFFKFEYRWSYSIYQQQSIMKKEIIIAERNIYYRYAVLVDSWSTMVGTRYVIFIFVDWCLY